MTERKLRKGFTLIEIMVVIAIIAIIASIAIVAVTGAMNDVKKRTCAVNMRNIYQGLAIFSGNNGGDFPTSFEYRKLSAAGQIPPPPNLSVGANCLFTLYQDGLVDPQNFSCPGQNHTANRLRRLPDGIINSENVLLEKYRVLMFDNSKPDEGRFCDYAFDPRRRGDDDIPGAVILTERPPTPQEIAANPSLNSPNHGRKGQNVMFPNGRVEWAENTNWGVEKDEIYTPNSDLGVQDSYCMP